MLNFSTLPTDLDPAYLPHHVAVIMDGNGRWATQRGLPRIAGHRQGAQTLKDLLRCCKDWGIATLTVYAFSTENWRRPLDEVNFLMRLFERLLQQELMEIHQQGGRLMFTGDLSKLPDALQRQMERAIALTAHNQAVCLNLAVNYGGRAELVQTVRQLAAQVHREELSVEDITESAIAQHLYTTGLPDPDLLIRTSGEMRLSNFLLWQLAYTELYFTETAWPDFDRAAFHQALLAYQQRDRRYGGLASTA